MIVFKWPCECMLSLVTIVESSYNFVLIAAIAIPAISTGDSRTRSPTYSTSKICKFIVSLDIFKAITDSESGLISLCGVHHQLCRANLILQALPCTPS